MTNDQRKSLLAAVSAGMDVEAGAAQLNLSMSEVRKSGKKFAKQLDEAYRTGSARLRARQLRAALKADDPKAISVLLEQRALTSDEGIRIIERIIINPPCPKCGHVQPIPGVNKSKSNGRAHE